MALALLVVAGVALGLGVTCCEVDHVAGASAGGEPADHHHPGAHDESDHHHHVEVQVANLAPAPTPVKDILPTGQPVLAPVTLPQLDGLACPRQRREPTAQTAGPPLYLRHGVLLL